MVRNKCKHKAKEEGCRAIQEPGLHFKLAFVCPMYNSEVTASASKFTRIQPMTIALPSLWPGCLVANLNRCQTYQRRQRGILCLFCYSIRCLCAVPMQEGIKELYNGHLRFISMQSFVQFFFRMPAVKRRKFQALST
jgi:hypothetical protein